MNIKRRYTLSCVDLKIKRLKWLMDYGDDRTTAIETFRLTYDMEKRNGLRPRMDRDHNDCYTCKGMRYQLDVVIWEE